MPRVLLFATGLILSTGSPFAPPAAAAGLTVRGCWEWSTPPGTPPQSLRRCFKSKSRLWGSSFDAGDGWDYGGRWRADGRRVTIRFDGEAAVTCSFVIDRRRRTLTLSACSSPSYDRTFSRSSHQEE